jgi:hypothetical protein
LAIRQFMVWFQYFYCSRIFLELCFIFEVVESNPVFCNPWQGYVTHQYIQNIICLQLIYRKSKYFCTKGIWDDLAHIHLSHGSVTCLSL